MIAPPPTSPLSPAPETPSQTAGLREAAQAFEAIFVRQLLASARASDFGGDDLFGGQDNGGGLDQFRAMQDENFADIASRSGTFGLAESIERQLSAHLSNPGETP